MKRVKQSLGLLLTAGLASGAYAIDPATVELAEGFVMVPTLNVAHGHDDNLFNSANNEDSSSYTTIAPSLAFIASSGKQECVLLFCGWGRGHLPRQL